MKRHTLILLMVGWLTLAACSNNAVESAGGNIASPGSTANPGGAADHGSTAGPAAEAAPASSALGLGGSATNPAAAASPTSAPTPAAAGHGGSAANPTDAATPTPPQPADPAGGGPAPAAGPADPLDQHTTQWFDTFCSTLATVASTRSDAADLNLGDAASMQSALIGALTTLGEVFHTATSTLAGLPPPTVTGGDHLAVTVTTAFGQDAQQFAASAAALGTTDPEDTQAQADATVRLNADAETATNLIDAVDSPGIPSDTRAAIQRIPSCQTVWP